MSTRIHTADWPRAKRQYAILARLDADDFVTVADLSAALGVSAMTVRRDLDDLHARRRLVRVHGGAMSRRAADALAPQAS